MEKHNCAEDGHIYSIWIDLNNGTAKRCCEAENCNHEEIMTINQDIKGQLEKQELASLVWQKFEQSNTEETNYLTELNKILEHAVPYLDLEKKRTLASKMETLKNSSRIDEGNKIFYSYLIPMLQVPQRNSMIYWEVMEEFLNYNQRSVLATQEIYQEKETIGRHH